MYLLSYDALRYASGKSIDFQLTGVIEYAGNGLAGS